MMRLTTLYQFHPLPEYRRGLEPTITYHGLDFLVAYHLAMLPKAPCE